MIALCPYCGAKLNKKLLEGISSCDNCLRIFDSSSFHKILSAFWIAKKWNWCELTLQSELNLNSEELLMVSESINNDYNYEEFFQFLKKRMST